MAKRKKGSIAIPFLLTFFIANESFSIIENLGEMGIKFPEKVTAAIKSLNNDKKED